MTNKRTQSRAMQFWSLALPILKCAMCPVCLSMFGGLFAGARMGLLGDERLHGGILAIAMLADLLILRAAMQHHQSRAPLLLCSLGGLVAVAGHITSEVVELVGFGLLMVAAIVNVVLLRRHRHEAGSCCAHVSGERSVSHKAA